MIHGTKLSKSDLLSQAAFPIQANVGLRIGMIGLWKRPSEDSQSSGVVTLPHELFSPPVPACHLPFHWPLCCWTTSCLALQLICDFRPVTPTLGFFPCPQGPTVFRYAFKELSSLCRRLLTCLSVPSASCSVRCRVSSPHLLTAFEIVWVFQVARSETFTASMNYKCHVP